MSIRLSKACKDLNVGMSTALEFLAKKGHKLAHDPNLKLEDDLHLLLAKEFNKDMALKIESERISQERHLKEKAATVALDGYNKPKPVEKQPETIHVTISEDQLPHFKPVGHIDLEPKDKHAEKRTETPAPKPVVEKAVVVEEKIIEKKEEPKPVVQEVKPEPKPVVEAPVEKPEVKPVVEEKILPKEPVKVEVKETPVAKEEPKAEEPKPEIVIPAKKFEVKTEVKAPEAEEPTEKNTEHKKITTTKKMKFFRWHALHWTLHR